MTHLGFTIGEAVSYTHLDVYKRQILTIEPGTKIVGEAGKNGGLIITRSCKIIADGTVDKPIVFTSEADRPVRGDWAGLVILGNAPTNASFNGCLL